MARACPELFGALVILLQCKVDYFVQVLRIQFHILSPREDYAITCVEKIAQWYFSFVANCKSNAFRGSCEHQQVTVRKECRFVRRIFGFAPCEGLAEPTNTKCASAQARVRTGCNTIVSPFAFLLASLAAEPSFRSRAASLPLAAQNRAGGAPQEPREPTHADILRGAYGPYRANNDLLSDYLDIRVDPDKKISAARTPSASTSRTIHASSLTCMPR